MIYTYICVWSEPTSHIYIYLHTYISSWTLYTLQLAVYTISTYIWSAPPWPGGYLSGASQGNTHQKLIKLQKLKKTEKHLKLFFSVFQFFQFCSPVPHGIMAGHSLAFPKSSSFNLQNCMVTVCVQSTQLHWTCADPHVSGAVCICIAPVCLYCSHVCSSRLVYPLFAVPSAWHRLRRTWPSMIWKLPATAIFAARFQHLLCPRFCHVAIGTTWASQCLSAPMQTIPRCTSSRSSPGTLWTFPSKILVVTTSMLSATRTCSCFLLPLVPRCLCHQMSSSTSCDRGKWWNSHHFEALPVPKQG